MRTNSDRRGLRSVTLVQTTVPAYRQGAVAALAARFGSGFAVLAGSEYFDPTIQLDANHRSLQLVSNRFLARRRLLWQQGVSRRAIAADVAIIELNPRIVSSWLILVVRRLLRRPTVLWGHAWPREGRRSRSDRFRQAMRRLGSAIVVYTETQARELSARMPGAVVRAAPNALYSRRAAGAATAPGQPRDVLFVGRLVKPKKPELLLDAFLAALPDLPEDLRLVFVGGGPLNAQLAATAGSLANGRIVFTGPKHAFEDLRALYSTALVSACPGYAGLSLIQSLWFGVPLIVAHGEPHSPEIEAATEGENAVFFQSDSVDSLHAALTSVAGARHAWRERRTAIAEECAGRYSLESMVESLASVVEFVDHER
jgi:glycosyltransferase involved in cell wall biosynthesis